MKIKILSAIAAIAAMLLAAAATLAAQGTGEKARVRPIDDREMISQVFDYTAATPHAVGSLPKVVDLWAPWCGPCRMLAPRLDSLAAEYDGRVEFVKINIDDNPMVATAFRVQSIPMLLFIPADGRGIQASLGVQPASLIREVIDGYLLKPAPDPVSTPAPAR